MVSESSPTNLLSPVFTEWVVGCLVTLLLWGDAEKATAGTEAGVTPKFSKIPGNWGIVGGEAPVNTLLPTSVATEGPKWKVFPGFAVDTKEWEEGAERAHGEEQTWTTAAFNLLERSEKSFWVFCLLSLLVIVWLKQWLLTPIHARLESWSSFDHFQTLK